MDQGFKESIEALGRQEKAFASLYRQMAKHFGLSECSMWIFYFLLVTEGQVSQQDLVEMMAFPKQTIHSAVKKMAEQGQVVLTKIPESKNRKEISLTKEGRAVVQQTVHKMLEAELVAIERFGQEKMGQLARLQGQYFALIQASFKEAGILEEVRNEHK